VDFVSKHWGDLASLLGFAFTIWLAWQAKGAAEEARDAALEAKNRILAFDAAGELSSATTSLQDIARLQRTQAWDLLWDVVLDRYEALILSLARSAAHTDLKGSHRDSLKSAIGMFRIMVGTIEGARSGEERSQLDTAKFNTYISEQMVVLEQIKISLKKAGT
jgi:hypothetical protein